MASDKLPRADGPVAALEGTWPLEEWPIDVQRVDESGVDLQQVEQQLTLTPAERVEQNYQARLLFEEVRKAGEKARGSTVRTDQAAR
jgi:hypothetical protein